LERCGFVHGLAATIDELTAAAGQGAKPVAAGQETSARLADCERKLTGYRAALDSGASPATVARWITETEAERDRLRAVQRAMPVQSAAVMTREQITSVVSALSDVLAVLRNARPEDKAAIYSELGLKLVYEPEGQLVRTEVDMMSPAEGGLHRNPNVCWLVFSQLRAGHERGTRLPVQALMNSHSSPGFPVG
jgi:hypothetical protein